MSEEKKFGKVLAFPKPKNNGGGSTVQFSYNEDSGCGFLTVAKQNSDTDVKNARFDYNNKIGVKLSEKDMASFVGVLSGKNKEINKGKGLYHQYKTTTTSIKMKLNDPKYGGYYISVIRSDGDNKNNVGVPITEDEGIILEIYLKRCIERIFE